MNNLNTELQDVQRIMVQVGQVSCDVTLFDLQNIDDVLQRGAVLSEMENKSQNLTEMSRKYRFGLTLHLFSKYQMEIYNDLQQCCSGKMPGV